MRRYADAVERTIAARWAFLKIDNQAHAALGPYSTRTNAEVYERWPGWAAALAAYQDAIDAECALVGVPALGAGRKRGPRGVTTHG